MNLFKKLLVILLVNNCNASIHYLDTTFGKNYNGISSTIIGNSSQVNSIVFANNKLVAAGSCAINSVQNIAVARYNIDGTLDTKFGSNGIVTTLSGTSSTANGVVVDTSGRVIVAGSSSSTKIILVRYNTNGSPDLTFGTGGIVTFTIPSNTSTAVSGVVLDANGKIVVGGTTILSSKNNLFAARFNASGSIDTTFNTTGYKTLTANSGYTASSIKIDANAKIVLGGSRTTNASKTNFLLVRLNNNGAVDSTFGSNGVVTTAIPAATVSSISSIFIDSSNRIVVAGYSGSSTAARFTVARYRTNGTLDTTFGTTLNGIQVTPVGGSSEANAVVIDLNGKIVAAGVSDNQNMIVRYTNNGSLDSTFGFSGIFINQIGNSAQIYSILIQPFDGRIVSGGLGNSLKKQTHFSLQRYNKNNIDFINVNIVNNSKIYTKIPVVSGISSGSNSLVAVYVKGVLFKTLTTDISGNWSVGNTDVLPIGNNVIEAVLLLRGGQNVAQKVKFTVKDNFAEDSIFAYSTESQISTNATYTEVPFNNLVKLGTWSYSDSAFKCNKSGTYLIQYVASAGATGTIPNDTTSIDVATSIAIDSTEYLGSEANKGFNLNSPKSATLTISFVKSLNAGQLISLKFAVNISGNSSGFDAGLLLSPSAIGTQPVYSLTITRIG